jgi:hypothetical protein
MGPSVHASYFWSGRTLRCIGLLKTMRSAPDLKATAESTSVWSRARTSDETRSGLSSTGSASGAVAGPSVRVAHDSTANPLVPKGEDPPVPFEKVGWCSGPHQFTPAIDRWPAIGGGRPTRWSTGGRATPACWSRTGDRTSRPAARTTPSGWSPARRCGHFGRCG